MKKIYPVIASAFMACLPVAAQNLNPEVQVTNDYVARMADVHKGGTAMSVPDSLTNFSTAIDYSVFKTDYQGAYDFSPYAISLEPEAKAYDGSLLFLRAGAGYSFHPVLRAVVTPVPKGLLRNSEYLSFDGYSGKYSSMDARPGYYGHDFAAGAGALLRWNKETFDLSGNLSWNGIYTADDALVSNYNKGELALNIHSNTPDVRTAYDFDASFHYAADRAGALGLTPEFGYVVDGWLSPEIARSFKLRIDVHSQISWFPGTGFDAAHLSSAAPKAVFEWGAVTLSAGAKIAHADRFSVHPDIAFDWLVGDGLLGLRLAVGGGQSLGDYAHYKGLDHWFNTSYLTKFRSTVEKINASLSVNGLMFKHLQYSFEGGYRILESAAVQGLAVDAAGLYVPGIAFKDYSEAYGKVLLAWKSDRLDVNFDGRYAYTNLAAGADYLTVPKLTLETSAVYNWNRRAYAGLRCKALTARKSTLVDIPGFVDLGLYGEYVFTGGLSAWLQVGNILNQQLSYSPTHIAGGVNFTAGICLKL